MSRSPAAINCIAGSAEAAGAEGRQQPLAFEIVVVGVSLGGLNALKTLLSELPEDFGLPIAIVQHRDRESGSGLVDALQEHCRLPVREAEDKEEIVPGGVWVAPPDYHLLVEGDRFALSIDAPVRHARPSIDVLFESAAKAFGPGVVGVILTGTSADGARGLALIKEAGGVAVAQEPATAECGVMPAAAIAATAVDHVLPLEDIPPLLVGLARGPLGTPTFGSRAAAAAVEPEGERAD